MKILVGNEYGSYSFNAAAKTITLSGLPFSLKMEQILIITDLVTNTMIYNFADPTAGAVSVSNNIITLDYDTTSLSNSDPLQIFIEAPDPTVDFTNLMQRLLKALESSATVDVANRQRVVVESLTGMTMPALVAGNALVGVVGTNVATGNTLLGNPYTVGACNVQGISEFPVDQRWRIINESRNAYANGIRSNLVFS